MLQMLIVNSMVFRFNLTTNIFFYPCLVDFQIFFKVQINSQRSLKMSLQPTEEHIFFGLKVP